MRLKIAVSVVRFRPWAPLKSMTSRTNCGDKLDVGDSWTTLRTTVGKFRTRAKMPIQIVAALTTMAVGEAGERHLALHHQKESAMPACRICRMADVGTHPPETRTIFYSCQRCGEYAVSVGTYRVARRDRRRSAAEDFSLDARAKSPRKPSHHSWGRYRDYCQHPGPHIRRKGRPCLRDCGREDDEVRSAIRGLQFCLDRASTLECSPRPTEDNGDKSRSELDRQKRTSRACLRCLPRLTP